MIKKLSNKAFIPACAIVLSSLMFIATVGKSGRTHIDSTTGCSCHTQSTNCVITISGPDTVAPNSVSTYTIVISGAGSTLGGGAIDIATNSGKITSTDTYLKISGTAGTEIVTSSRKPSTASTITYILSYTAPASAGSAKLCATGMWSSGSGSSGDYWAFAPDKTIAIVPTATTVPDVPVPVAPVTGATGQAKIGIQFVWNRAANTEHYTFQLSNANSFTSVIYTDTTLIDSTLVLPNVGLTNSTKYYWRVLATNYLGSSSWSSAYDFTTVAGSPLTGVKTIGGTSPDYLTIKSALNDLSVQGTTAPGVTFTIRDGNYTVDTLVVQTATSNASSPVTIKPESGATVSITGTAGASSPFVIKIDNTSYVTIDGGSTRSLSIIGSGTNAQRAVYVVGNSQFTTIKNCIVKAGAYSSGSYNAIELSSPTAKMSAHNSVIENNIVGSAYYGIRLIGNGASDSLLNVVVKNNIVDSVAVAGIYTTNTAYGQIYGNDVSVLLGGGSALTSAMYGIYAGSNTDNMRIYNNRVHDINQQSTSTSITYGISSNTGASGQGGNVIYNNFISLNITQANGTGSIYPIYISESTIPDSVLFNTVKLSGTGTGIRSSTGFYKGSTTGSCVVKNNILINIRTDAATAIATAIGRPSTGTTATMISDYNDLYVGTDTVQHKIGRLSTASYYQTLASWAAINAGDAGSISEDAPFISDTDLHIKAGITTGLKNAGTPIPGYTKDIDGELRNSTHPDMGADEFSGKVTSVEAVNTVLPSGFGLRQNYPNPFNPATTIQFVVQHDEFATVKIYSMVGQELKTLFANNAVGGQLQTVHFDASELSSGAYYYILITATGSDVKKMILLK